MKALDIIVHANLFGEWEVTTAENYFATSMVLEQIGYLPRALFPTFEDCKTHLRETFNPCGAILQI